jgi:hypothetical protein
MEAQKLAVDTIVDTTGCDRAEVTAFIGRYYRGGLKDSKRLTFRGMQFFKKQLFKGNP